MAIACLPSETNFDVRCPVCGHGFLLLWEPTLHPHRGHLREAARQALAAQHTHGGLQPHPDEVFDLPMDEREPSRHPLHWLHTSPDGLTEI